MSVDYAPRPMFRATGKLLIPLLGLRLEDLYDRAKGLGGPAIRFDAHDAVVEENGDGIIRVVFRIHRKSIDAVRFDGRISLRCDARRLRPREQWQRGNQCECATKL